jgi:hypothetical protein
LTEIVISNLDLLSDESVSPALERLEIYLDASHKDVNVWTMWCPSSQLELLTEVTVRVDALHQPYAFPVSNGDSFFAAFPRATKLTFSPSPSCQFWTSCPDAALERITYLSLHSVETSGAFLVRASHLVNLESLKLREPGLPGFLRDLVRGPAVFPMVTSLELAADHDIFHDEGTWSYLATTFPALVALDLDIRPRKNENGDLARVQRKVLEELIPNTFQNLAYVSMDIWSVPLASCLLMATKFLKKDKLADWNLSFDGHNVDDETRPTILQGMLDLLVHNPSCEVEFRGSVEPNAHFVLSVESV